MLPVQKNGSTQVFNNCSLHTMTPTFRHALTAVATATALLLGTAAPLAAWAQTGTDHSHHAAAPAKSAALAADQAEGEVRKLDLDAGKVTLKHGEIKSLDMPPMTMVFTAADKTLLAPLKVGDKVRFKAVHEAGKYVVTDIQPSP